MTEIIGRRKTSTYLLKKENKRFYKLVDHNMMGKNGYKYEVGKIFEVSYDNGDELHFCDNIFSTFKYGNGEHKSIILEVEPLSDRCYCDEHHEYSCDKLKVIRILDDKEILCALNKPRGCLSTYSSPILCYYFTYEYLIKYKDQINRNPKALKIIYESKELTEIQKKEIIKKSKLKLL